MNKLVSDTTFERIRLNLLGEDIELSDHEEKVKIRWNAAFTFQLNNIESDREICTKLVKMFAISDTQAYRDIACARNLYGDVRKSSKDGLRYLVTQWLIEMLAIAKTEKDFKAMERLAGRIIMANNLNMEDSDLPDASKIQPPIQILAISLNFMNSKYADSIDSTTKEKLQMLLNKFNKMAEEMGLKDYLDMFTEDIPHKEIPDAD